MVLPAVVVALCCGALALAMPAWLARLPEPDPDPPPAELDPGVDADAVAPSALSARTLAPAPPKEPYADIAVLPGLRTGLVVASVVAGGLVGWRLGWTGALVYLVPLVPVGALLLVVDWRTTLLPTRLIRPTYAALVLLLVVAAAIDRDPGGLLRAVWGFVLVGGFFWLCWWLLGAWGFGDVRLARVLGPALGYLGWSELVVGLLLMLFVGALGGVVLTLRDRSLRRRYPYGPFMLVGALATVLWGPAVAVAFGYPPL